MKKIVSSLLMVSLLFTLVGCRRDEGEISIEGQTIPVQQSPTDTNENSEEEHLPEQTTKQEPSGEKQTNAPSLSPSLESKQDPAQNTDSPTHTSEGSNKEENTLEYSLEKEVRFFGRTYEADGVYWFDMTLSGFEFSFNGTGAQAVLCTESGGADHTAYIKVYVDGAKAISMAINEDMQTVTLAKNLKKGQHTVRVVKRTNARSSSAGLYSLTLTKGGTKLAPPAEKKRKMEFIGDSLTVGYGAIATSATTKWSTATEDGTQTFAALTADHFNAEAQTVAVSGRGVVHNVDGDSDKLLPELFEYADLYHSSQKWDFSRYQPDVVVINAGTNDKATTQVEMKTAMSSFIKNVRSKYKNAYIVLAYSPSSNDFTNTYKSIVQGQSKMSFVSLPVLSAEQVVLGHPNTAGHKLWAQTLEKHIESLGVWK